MNRAQIPLFGLMALVALVAIGLTALRNPVELWSSILFSLTVAMLSSAILAATASQGRERLCWVGFALFGWIYVAFAFVIPAQAGFQRHGTPPLATDLVHEFFDQRRVLLTLYVRGILHSIGALLAAMCGYVTAHLLAQRSEPRP